MLHPFVPIYITWRWWPTIHILPLVTKLKWTGWVRIGLGELFHYIIKLCYITAAGGSWVEQLNCDNGRWDLKSGSSVALPAVNGNRINWCFVIGVCLHLALFVWLAFAAVEIFLHLTQESDILHFCLEDYFWPIDYRTECKDLRKQHLTPLTSPSVPAPGVSNL